MFNRFTRTVESELDNKATFFPLDPTLKRRENDISANGGLRLVVLDVDW